MKTKRVVLRGGNVWRKDRGFEKSDLVVGCLDEDGNPEEIDISGKYVLPGLADVHVHLREPGYPGKETIAAGTRAAARGGFTCVCTMPNLNPVPDCLKNLKAQTAIIARDAVIRVIPYASITRGRKGRGEIVDMEMLRPLVAGFSDDGCGIQDEAVMEQAMLLAAGNKAIIAAHCEDERLVGGGCIHDGEYARSNGFKGISSESEWRQVERDLALAERTGCKYHVCHVSTAESVELIRQAKSRGVDVTCETAPHYLLLCDEDLQNDGRFKMNPPLRSAADREALIAGICDGTIDIIATDHAPHTAKEKSRGLTDSAFGIVGLETAFPLMYTEFVRTGRMPFAKLLDLMCYNPRKRFGLDTLAADITVFDLDESYTVDPSEFLSLGKSTPFTGRTVYGRCLLTIADGKMAYRK